MQNLENIDYIDREPDFRAKEKLPVEVFATADKASKFVAEEIAKCIIEKQKQNKKCVLGLATGSTPLGVYKHLIQMHKNEGLSFKNVVTFNLDEYYPIKKDNL